MAQGQALVESTQDAGALEMSPQGEEPKGRAFLSSFPILSDTDGIFAKVGTLILLLLGF